MVGFLHWFTHKAFGRFPAARAAAPDDLARFDRVDAQMLELGQFRASGSMLFDDAPVNDFTDTLPAYSRAVRVPHRRAATRRG